MTNPPTPQQFENKIDRMRRIATEKLEAAISDAKTAYQYEMDFIDEMAGKADQRKTDQKDGE
jgi:hypothetical protein